MRWDKRSHCEEPAGQHGPLPRMYGFVAKRSDDYTIDQFPQIRGFPHPGAHWGTLQTRSYSLEITVNWIGRRLSGDEWYG